MSKFIKLECPNRNNGRKPTIECRHMMAGLSLDTINNHDFSTPIVDMRYCQNCNSFWKVTIPSKDGLVNMERIEGEVSFVKADELFVGISVEGRKIKGGSSRDNYSRHKG